MIKNSLFKKKIKEDIYAISFKKGDRLTIETLDGGLDRGSYFHFFLSRNKVQNVQTTGLPASSAQLVQHQLAYQQIHQQQQQQLQQQLQGFWQTQYQEIEQATDFKNHSLPLARIKKIMKADEDVRMISAAAPVVFARACEMFILELTLRARNHTEEELKEEVLATIPRGTLPVGPPDSLPYYYMPPQTGPQVGAPSMYVGKPVDQSFYGQQARLYMGQQM